MKALVKCKKCLWKGTPEQLLEGYAFDYDQRGNVRQGRVGICPVCGGTNVVGSMAQDEKVGVIQA